MPRATWGNVGEDPFGSELDEFEVYEGETPPKGVYRCWLKGLRLKQNRNNEPMLNGLLVVKERKGSKKAKFNGYSFWFNLNVTKQGAPWVNDFLDALTPTNKSRALRKAFWEQKVMIDKDEPPGVLSIGTLKVMADGAKEIFLKANCKFVPRKDDYDEKLDVLRFLRDTDEVPADTDEEAEADADADDSGWEPDEDDAGEDDEELAEREEELGELDSGELKKILKANHAKKLADYKGKSTEELIEMILDLEFPENEDEDEDDDDDDTADEDDEEAREALEEELGELTLAELKKLARSAEYGFKLAEIKGLDLDGLVDLMLDRKFPPSEAEEEAETEPEAEPEEQKRPRFARRGSAAGAKRGKNEPPF